MPRHPLWRAIRSSGMVLATVVCLGGAIAQAAAEVPDVDPAGVTDPIERKFYQELRDLREKQRLQRQNLSAEDLTPEARLEKRRALLIESHKEIQSLEAVYQSKLSPEARSRWMERKANRQKRFDNLQDKSSGSAPGPLEDKKSSRKKSR